MSGMLRYKNYISKIVFIFWIILILMSLCFLQEDILDILLSKKRYIRLIELLIVLGILCESIFLIHACCNWSIKKKCIWIFIIALCIRLIFLPIGKYIPTSDFSNYFLGACHFSNIGFDGGVYPGLEGYGIPSFAGQAIINGTLLNILSPTLLGMQILNSIYTSGICLLLFILGKNINEKAAMISVAIYTFYPCSILSTQITTNHHGAAFFILISIYIFFHSLKQKNKMNRVIYLTISAVCLVISNYYHPSVIITLCAFIVYMFFYELDMWINQPSIFFKEILNKIRDINGISISVIILIVLYIGIWNSSITLIKNSGYVQNTTTMSVVSKIAVGFNFETNGTYSYNDYAYIQSFPEKEQGKESIRLAAKRIQENGLKSTANLLLQKNQRAWFGTDNYFWFYQSGMQEKIIDRIENINNPILKEDYEKQLENLKYWITDIAIANSFFVYFVWFLALIGIVHILLRYKNDNILYLLMYIPLGWMLFIMISEMQPRYRYQGMVIIVFIAGFGAEAIRQQIIKIYYKLLRNKKEI